MSFDRVRGHDRVRNLLGRLVVEKRLPPSLLLAGPSGVGKRTLAVEVGRALLCLEGRGRVCGSCSVCRRTEHTIFSLPELREAALRELDRSTGEAKDAAARLFNVRLHPDLILVQPSGVGRSESIKVAQVRDIVAEAAMRPFEGATRVVVVDSAHLLVEQGANAFLKTLEEPPADTHFILVSDSVDMLLRTIRSRCQILRMGPLSDDVVAAYLREVASLGAEEARLRAALAGGSLGLAMQLDADAWLGLRNDWLDVLEALPKLPASGRFDLAERFASLGPDGDRGQTVAASLSALRSLLRDVAVLRATTQGRVQNVDVEERLRTLAASPFGARAGDLAERAAESRNALLVGNANAGMVLDALFEALR